MFIFGLAGRRVNVILVRIFAGVYMRKLGLSASVLVLISASAVLAQENQIRVVQPDGSVQAVDIPVAPVPKPVPAPQAAPEVLPAEAAPASIIPAEKPAAEKIEAVKVDKKPVPAKNKSAKKEKPKDMPPPLPTRAESHGRIPEPAPEEALAVPQGTVITKEIAVQIALEHAPPARSMIVVPRSFEGRDVFVVMFKTDTGDYDVLVDAVTGEIIKPQ